jgi:hypothetical protein
MISHISSSGEWSAGSSRIQIAASSRSGDLNNSVALCHSQGLGESAWEKLVRDVAAIANSGGGRLDLPVDSNACPISVILVTEIVARLAHCTGSKFDDVQLANRTAGTPDVWELEVGPAEFPIGFKQPFDGNTLGESSPLARPFVPGVFYFWHDGKSTLATSDDFQALVERRVNDARQRWSKEIGRVLSRPLAPRRRKRRARRGTKQSPRSSNDLQPVRIVNDANAPALQPQHVDQLYRFDGNTCWMNGRISCFIFLAPAAVIAPPQRNGCWQNMRLIPSFFIRHI